GSHARSMRRPRTPRRSLSRAAPCREAGPAAGSSRRDGRGAEPREQRYRGRVALEHVGLRLVMSDRVAVPGAQEEPVLTARVMQRPQSVVVREVVPAHVTGGTVVVEHPAKVNRVELRPVVHVRSSTQSEEHTSELQSPYDLVCRLLLEKKKIEQHPRVTLPISKTNTNVHLPHSR